MVVVCLYVLVPFENLDELAEIQCMEDQVVH